VPAPVLNARRPTRITHAQVGWVRARFQLDWRGIHGAAHWSRVRHNGLLLAERTGADSHVVELFALFHDSCREHDGGDPLHGDRSADWLLDIGAARLGIGQEQLLLLEAACRGHSHGGLDAEPTVQVCWDADRLDLARVGIMPLPERLCTAAARDGEVIEWAVRRSLATRSRRT
jgi:uncharacterized protein